MKTYPLLWLSFTILIAGTAVSTSAGIEVFRDADSCRAFNAGEDQRIWDRPRNLVTEAVSWPISRFTVTIYDDQNNKPDTPKTAFLTLTHTNPKTGQRVTFYYNLTVMPEERSLLSLNMPEGGGMWEDGASWN